MKTELMCFSLLLLGILLLTTGCSSNTYAIDCYKDNQLVYRSTQRYLFHFSDTTKYDECNTYTIGSER